MRNRSERTALPHRDSTHGEQYETGRNALIQREARPNREQRRGGNRKEIARRECRGKISHQLLKETDYKRRVTVAFEAF